MDNFENILIHIYGKRQKLHIFTFKYIMKGSDSEPFHW